MLDEVKKKIEHPHWFFYWLIVIFAILLFITLLRSQIRTFWNLALNSNSAVRRADNKQYFLTLFSSAADRGRPAGLRFDNNQRQYAVGYTLQTPSRNNGRWFPPATGRLELSDPAFGGVEHNITRIRVAPRGWRKKSTGTYWADI